MPKFLWVVQANATSGQDDAFNAWYSDQHMHDILAADGVNAVQRFQLIENHGRTESRYRYLAVYEVEADSPAAIEAAVAARRAEGLAPSSDTLDRADFISAYYAPLTERVAKS